MKPTCIWHLIIFAISLQSTDVFAGKWWTPLTIDAKLLTPAAKSATNPSNRLTPFYPAHTGKIMNNSGSVKNTKLKANMVGIIEENEGKKVSE